MSFFARRLRAARNTSRPKFRPSFELLEGRVVPATHFSVSAPGTETAGSAVNFTVTALNADNSIDTNYSGTAHFTSSDGSATLPADLMLTNGVGNLSATLKTAGSQTITAMDSTDSSITGTSSSIVVSAAAATHFGVSAPGTATAGTAFSFTVTALDQFNNTATGYAGTVHFTSTDSQAALPANSTLTSGVGTFSATLKTAGNQTITATDSVNSSITGTSNTIADSSATATHFGITSPSSATAGTAFSFTVTALDQFNNTVTGYTGTVHFTTNDGAGVMPADSTLNNGVGTFSATLKTAGSRTITATDTAITTLTGTSAQFTVKGAAATHFVVSAPSSATITSPISFSVIALDQFNNTATGYTGTVHFTSTDSKAVLPIDSILVNGTGNFQATFESAGTQTITATDTTTSSITGTSNTVTINTAPAITSASSATFTVTNAGTFLVTTTGVPNPTLTETGNLPVGVTFKDNGNGTATLSGTPTTSGTFTITIKASNKIGVDATQTFTLTVSGIPPYAVTQNQKFVAHAYLDLLSRFVEQQAMSFWAGAIDSGVSRSAVVLALENTNEYRIDVVQDLYQKYLKRAADAGGLQMGVSFLASGGTQEHLAAIIVGSQEFFRLQGGNSSTSFVTALFQDALGRAPDAQALTLNSAGINTGAVTPQQVALFVFGSEEYSNVLVADSYQTFLRRSADSAGVLHFAQSLQSGMTDEQLVATLIGSTEYLQTQVGS